MSKQKKLSSKTSRSQQPTQDTFPIVGLGASAGGLEAFEKFFTRLPADTGMAFVIVQHLDPHHKSMLTEILRKYTGMPVHEITNDMVASVNHVYVIPPNSTLSISEGAFQLTQPRQPRGRRLPIDTFFRSLAQEQRERAICIILSGTGTDGSLGMKTIKEYGGLCIVQQESSAKYGDMPRSAISTGLVDYVLPVEEMPNKLIEYVRHATFEQRVKESIAAVPDDLDEHLQDIHRLLKAQTGHDFSLYKRNTILRRIARRISVHQLEGMADYVRYLQKDSSEIEALFRELLIGVTNFFRDPEAFQALEKQVIPKILAAKNRNDAVRVWVTGCSTGEEAYSLAMMFMEQMAEQRSNLHLQIFATDIDEEALQVARAGVYPESIAADVSEERLARFFTQEGNHYYINKQLREAIIFASHNLIKDPPFSRLDLVTCRNLLIYLGPELQKRVMPLFHYTLNLRGFLFLGTSENIGTFTDLFEVVDKKRRVFRRKGIGTPASAFPLLRDRGTTTLMAHEKLEGRSERARIGDLTEKLLLELYAPAAVVINEHEEIVHYYGRTGSYLEPASGEPSHNIIRMARQGLRADLRRALLKALNSQETAVREKVLVKSNGRQHYIKLIVHPMSKPESANGLYLVIFQDLEALEESSEGISLLDLEQVDPLMRQLELELKDIREDLQTTIEELETSNEELKSGNEELQSTNEELETSKGELQSVNEELVTVNSELHHKVEELGQANSDISNLLISTQIPTIILTDDLRIKRFTPSAGEVFNLIASDVERPLHHISHNLNYQDLLSDIQQVLISLQPQEREVKTVTGDWYIMRILPYLTIHNVIDGAILTFANVTAIREAKASLEKQYQQLQILYQTTETLSQTDELQEIFAASLQGLKDTLQIQLASIHILDDSKNMRLRAWQGLSGQYQQNAPGHTPWSLDDMDNIEPILIHNIVDEKSVEAMHEVLVQEGVQALGFIPIRHQGQLLGQLTVYYQEPHVFDEEEIKLIQALATNGAFAIHQARQHKALRQHAQQQSVIAALGQQALKGEPLEDFMNSVVQQMVQTLDLEFGKILQWQPESHSLLLQAGVGWQDGLVGTARVEDEQRSQAGYTLLQSEPVLVQDLQTETRFSGSDLLIQHKVVSGMSVVIEGNERPYGVLGAHTTRNQPFSQDDIRFLQSIANIVGTAIQRHLAAQLLQTMNEQLEERVEMRTVQLKKQISQRREAERARQRESEETKLLQEIAIAANQATSLEDALRFSLEKICGYMDWPLAHIYILESERIPNGRTDKMIASGIWHCSDEQKLELFRTMTQDTSFIADESWLGQVINSGKPSWIQDISQDELFPRNRQLADIEAKMGFALPVLVGEEVAAILEFFPSSDSEPDENVLQLMGYIGTQLGRVVERNRANREIQRSLDRLLASQQRLAEAQQLAHLGSWAWDIVHDRVIWSDEHYRILGAQPGDFEPERKTVQKQLHPHDLAVFTEAIAHTLETREPYDVLVRVKRLDNGEYVIVNTRGMVITNKEDEVVALRGTIQDVTVQRHMELALQQSQSMLAEAQRMSHLGSWEWDLKSQEIIWSDELYNIYRVDKETFDLDMENILSYLHPEDRVAAQERPRQFLETGDMQEAHLRIVLPGGEIRYLRSHLLASTNDEGEPVRLLGTMQDETDYKLAAEQISRKASQLVALNMMGQTAVSSLDLDAIFNQVLETTRTVLQAEGIFILLSKPEKETFQFVAVRGESFQQLKGLEVPMNKGIASEVFQSNEAIVAQGKAAVTQRVYKQVKELAEPKIGVMLVAPMRVQDKIIGVLEAIHSQEDAFAADDLSILETAAAWAAIALSNSQLYEELHTREERLQELTDQMVTAQEEERGRISRELHDESAQSLTALKLILEVIASDVKDESLDEHLAQARELIQQTMQRIRLLAYALRPPELENLGLDAALRDLCRIFEQRANLQISYSSSGKSTPELPDATQLSFYRFLQEALTNVIRHAEATEVEVQLDHNDQEISVSVRDNGQGFAPTETRGDRLGLGLLGMRERFERLGGNLIIESEPGSGATLISCVALS